MKYLDKLPEMCRDQNALKDKKGEDLLKFWGICGVEGVVVKYRFPEFPYAHAIPSTPVSDADCTFSKIMSLPLETNERGGRAMACSLRGIIGKDPDKVSNNQIRRTLKKNAAKLLETTGDFSANCSSKDFQGIDLLTMFEKIKDQDNCLIIELIKQRANGELYEEDEEDLDDNGSDEIQNEASDKGVMEVIKEQMKGILKLIKTSTGRDISDDGNIIIAYTNVFQVKPRKNTH